MSPHSETHLCTQHPAASLESFLWNCSLLKSSRCCVLSRLNTGGGVERKEKKRGERHMSGSEAKKFKIETRGAIKRPRRSEESQKDIKRWRFRACGEMFIYLLSILKHKLIISHSAGAFGSPSSRFTVKDYGSLKRGTGSKQCVAIKNGDASQTRCSNHTETQCTSFSDLTKYTRTTSDALTALMCIPWLLGCHHKLLVL